MLNKSSLNSKSKGRCVLNFTDEEAVAFFLKPGSYSNFDLPGYFKFDKILNKLNQKLRGKSINKCKPVPRKYDDVNHKILNNKDGQFAWRQLELIHPVLYVSLIHKITEKENWKLIQSRFEEFSKEKCITCYSLPRESIDGYSDKEHKISSWWHEIEQKSIELALDYSFLIKTDIAECYASIYTHSIAWALHEKAYAKKNRNDKKLIGNIIDNYIQDMSHGQTNGIPQGSVLMDFIAEMVLGYADLQLACRINGTIDDYQIIRYRDDYRIFTNNQQDAKKIIKLLSEVLLELGLKMNKNKTEACEQVIRGAIKKDKLYWICQKQENKDIQKYLLIIYELSLQHPNSGSLIKALNKYFIRIKRNKNFKQIDQLKPIISILTDIAFKNPISYPIIVSILSEFFKFFDEKEIKKDVIEKIIKKFSNIPNTEHLELWLQRITLPAKLEISYENKLSKLVSGNQNVIIWNSEWLKDEELKKIIETTPIIDKKRIMSLPETIESKEVALFINGYC